MTISILKSTYVFFVLIAYVISSVIGQRVVNPPAEGMVQYKFRQWTQQTNDTSWCAAIEPSDSMDDQNRSLIEEKCEIASTRQYFHTWEVSQDSDVYMFRSVDGALCMTSHSRAMPGALARQRRSVDIDYTQLPVPTPDPKFCDKLVHGGHIKRKRRIPRQLFNQPTLTLTNEATPSAVNNPNPLPVIDTIPSPRPITFNAPAVPVTFAKCVGSNEQLFSARLVVLPEVKHAYYQIQSLANQLCLTGNQSDIALTPCNETDASQLWLFEDVHQIIDDVDDQMTIYDYAAAFQIHNFEHRLGLRRDAPDLSLTIQETLMLQHIHPAITHIFDMAFRLSRYIRVYVTNMWRYHQSGTTVVSNLVRLFLTPDKYKPVWEDAWIIGRAIINALPLPTIPKVVLRGAATIADFFIRRAKNNEPTGPTPTDELAWDRYALSQSDVVADQLYDGFNELLHSITIHEMLQLLEAFERGEYQIDANEFYRLYQINIVQTILTAGKDEFWIGVCTHEDSTECRGRIWDSKLGKNMRRFYQDAYTSNVPDAGTAYIRDVLHEEDNFYKGKGNWKLTRYLYSCLGGFCSIQLVLRGGADSKDIQIY
jgi:hypothetical protein